MNRIGYVVSTGCFPTREAAEARKKVLEQKGVSASVEDLDALTMRELVTAIMCVEKRIGQLVDVIRDMDAAAVTPPAPAESVTPPTGRPMTALGRLIHRRMTEAGMTRQQLAAKAGCSDSSVINTIYANMPTPNVDLQARIAMAAGVPYSIYEPLLSGDR